MSTDARIVTPTPPKAKPPVGVEATSERALNEFTYACKAWMTHMTPNDRDEAIRIAQRVAAELVED